MKVFPTKSFEKSVKKMTKTERDLINQALKRFIENPRHPSLHFEKLRGSPYRTIRVNSDIRIALIGEDDDYELIEVNHHDVIYRRYG